MEKQIDPVTGQHCKNKKTGHTYVVAMPYVVHSTNGENNGERMVCYFRLGEQLMYVRTYEEFMEKFELLDFKVQE